MKTIGLFCDVSNIYYCVNKAFPGRKVDYLKYLDRITGNDAIFRAYAFGIQNNYDSVKFVSCLKHIGYDPRFKEFDPKNVRINNNVLIAVELFKIIHKLDIVVIGSSDPNLADLIVWAKDQGVEVQVYACGINRYLKEVASKYIEILEEELEDVQQ